MTNVLPLVPFVSVNVLTIVVSFLRSTRSPPSLLPDKTVISEGDRSSQFLRV